MERILIVDENREDLKQAAELLKEQYKVSVVKTADQVFAYLSLFQPDLMLVAVGMPGMEGFHIVKQIQSEERYRKIPILFCETGYSPELEATCFEQGGVDFITKPFVQETLLHRVKQHLEFYRYQQRLEQVLDERTRGLAENLEQTERLQLELEIASKIQMSMLPTSYPAFPGREDFCVYATMEPAKEVGGDFYDYFLLDKDHLAFCIGDASGKGVPAALFMIRTKTILNVEAMKQQSGTGSILEKVNQKLCQGNSESMFVTLFLGILDLKTGRLQYTNAGHNPPLIGRKGNFQFFVEEPDLALGCTQKADFQEYDCLLSPGDRIFCYTDGLTESMNEQGELFGEIRLKDLLNHMKVEQMSMPQVTDEIKKCLSLYAKEQADDLTMLLLDLLPKEGEETL